MKIWITGCTSGLGRALVTEFIKAGHTVVGAGRNEQKLATLRGAYPDHHFIALEVSSEESVRDFCTQAEAATGAPDLLINNAAIINPNAKLWEIPAAQFDELTAININGVANMIRHTVPMMLSAGSGVIVNLSSGWGRSTSPEVAPYCASKWAIEGLTKALAQELPRGLGAVALNPGIINTEMLQRTFGPDAEMFPTAATWAKTAAPYITGITSAQNGQSLTAP